MLDGNYTGLCTKTGRPTCEPSIGVWRVHCIYTWPSWPTSKLQQSASSCFCYFIGLTVHAILSLLVWDGHLHVVLAKLCHIVSPSPDLNPAHSHIPGLRPVTQNKCPVQLHFKSFTALLHSSTVIKVTGTVQYISIIWLTDRSPHHRTLPLILMTFHTVAQQ